MGVNMLDSKNDNLVSSVNILLVEDNLINGKLVVKMLEISGYNVEWARNGLEAIQHIENSPHKFQIVFMDVQMPEMDGIEATQWIRKNGFDIPVVAMTAHALKGDREVCLDAGMNDYITKPLKKEDLVNMVERWAAC